MIAAGAEPAGLLAVEHGKDRELRTFESLLDENAAPGIAEHPRLEDGAQGIGRLIAVVAHADTLARGQARRLDHARSWVGPEMIEGSGQIVEVMRTGRLDACRFEEFLGEGLVALEA